MECVFCRIAEGTLPSTRVLETESVLAFRDLSPQAPVHVLVIPRRHVGSLAEFGENRGANGDGEAEDSALAGALLLAAAEVARIEGIADEGYRVVANTGDHGGQTVGHLHLHVLGGRALGWPPG